MLNGKKTMGKTKMITMFENTQKVRRRNIRSASLPRSSHRAPFC